MGQIVPDPVEQYLASLNRQADAVLQDIAETGAIEDLPLIDAEVGALLRVLATALGFSGGPLTRVALTVLAAATDLMTADSLLRRPEVS